MLLLLLINSYAVRHTHFHDVTDGTHIFGYALARRLSLYCCHVDMCVNDFFDVARYLSVCMSVCLYVCNIGVLYPD